MNALKGVPFVLSLLVMVAVTGCSSLRNEPLYQDVPDPSAPAVAEGEPAEAADDAAAATAALEAATAEAAEPEAEATAEPIVTPDDTLTGKIVSVNAPGRFVVIRFPVGRMPAPDSRLSVYRQGLKVAEVKVTGPQRDDHTVADIITGDCQRADEVKDR